MAWSHHLDGKHFYKFRQGCTELEGIGFIVTTPSGENAKSIFTAN